MIFERLRIAVGETVDRDELLGTLVRFGFRRTDAVGEPGDFALRGSLLDIYLVDFQDPVRIDFHGNRVETIASFDAASGSLLIRHPFVILLPIGELRKHKLVRRLPILSEEVPIDNFVDIEPGDLVVHVEHGIGRYLGLEKVREGRRTRDHLVLEYAGRDRLLVPMEELNLVQKYIGFEGRPPRLSTLGSPLWQRTKARAREGVASVARDLLELQAGRLLKEGFRYSADHPWQKALEESFPFKETPDQLKATEEVKRDMESSRPMDRLLCGDVGYGKTEVALRAAFKAVMDHKQVALLVPTTILAEQHMQTFRDRLASFPVRVEMISRFRTALEQELLLKDLDQGLVDIVIGTHRLLSDDVHFKDLGLLIVDEEQRFGVLHKERLKRLRREVDVLTLTATPIPRTLYMALLGAKDLSVVNSPPADRLPIATRIAEFDEGLLRQAVERELARKGQVFFVHNRVQGIEKFARKIQAMVPKARLAVAHGQMSSRTLETVMLDFIHGKLDVLVSTTIIESGIDIPNANTLIVNNADRFGLAELYQLRGRVGRFTVKAHALFLIPRGAVLAQESRKRLEAIQRFTELGSGFRIAMQDLQIRGAGNLLGLEQHGFIEQVGFDLYCRLLREAVRRLGEKSGRSSLQKKL